jgi:hypothetical protein
LALLAGCQEVPAAAAAAAEEAPAAKPTAGPVRRAKAVTAAGLTASRRGVPVVVAVVLALSAVTLRRTWAATEVRDAWCGAIITLAAEVAQLTMTSPARPVMAASAVVVSVGATLCFQQVAEWLTQAAVAVGEGPPSETAAPAS